MTFTRTQRAILSVYFLAVAVACTVVPWRVSYWSEGDYRAEELGYGLVLIPPTGSGRLGRLAARGLVPYHVVIERVILEIAALTALAGFALALTHCPRRRDEE